MVLLHRAAPFDQRAQSVLCAAWGLPLPQPSPYVGYLDPPAGTTGQRLKGVHNRLARLTAASAPPPVLLCALGLAAQLPTASEAGLGTALRLIGASDGTATPQLLLNLAALWQLPVPRTFELSDAAHAELRATAARTRHAGILQSPAPPAGHAAPLRSTGVVYETGHLVAVRDRSSLLARPVHRQLAAIGPMTPAELVVGARRERPQLSALTGDQLALWASHQDDLRLEGGAIALRPGARPWLQTTR